jgi:5-methylcytosine-specific restriction endonuclease McrA
METILVVKEICSLLIKDKKQEAIKLAKTHLPFNGEYNVYEDITKEKIKLIKQNIVPEDKNCKQTENESIVKKNYQKHINAVLLRDGFIDRYTGDKLVFPGILFLLHFEIPEIFRYNKNWKPEVCHKIFWELYPTVDHIHAQANGGSHELDNLITTLQVINNHKSKKNFEKINWERKDEGVLSNWDGLTTMFFELMKKKNDYAGYTDLPNWKTRYTGIKRWKSGMEKALDNCNYSLLDYALN